MFSTLAVFLLKSASSAVSFVFTHWRVVLALIFICLYSYACYSYGFNKCDQIWIKQHETKVAAANARIADLEADSRVAGKQLVTEVAAVKDRLTMVLNKKPAGHSYDANGNVAKCNNVEQTLYLGTDFTATWNALNQEGSVKP